MAEPARPRRWRRFFGVLALLVLLGWWFVDRQLQPERLTRTVLDRLGSSLQLDIAFEGTPDYAFSPEPRLRVPNLVVTDPATGRPVLSAKRLEVSLPWSTVRGGDVVITRLELDSPVLDVDGLQRWLASRPPAPFRLPTLTRGMAVADGSVLGDGWALHELALDLPRLATGEPADLHASTRFVRGDTDARLRGQVHVDAAAAASAFSVQARGELAREPAPLEGTAAAQGRFRFADGGFTLLADRLALDGDSPLPSLAGEAYVARHGQLSLGFRGRLATWPQAWPALPPPVGAARGPFPVTAVYRGEPDFSGPLQLALAVGETKVDARTRLPEMLAWIDEPSTSRLPPLEGTLTTPRLDIEGVVLRGVRAVIDDGDQAPTAATP